MQKLIQGILYVRNTIVGFLSSRWNIIVLWLYGCQFGERLRTNGRIRVRNYGRIQIGNDVTINSSVMSNPLGGSSCAILVSGKQGSIQIGNNVGISNATLFAQDCISIGDNTLIGAGVKIYDSDFHPIDSDKRRNKEKPVIEPVRVGKDVFIGAHSIILKGVSIGDRSVVGAGSVVTKSIPSEEIWAGNPARFIRKV